MKKTLKRITIKTMALLMFASAMPMPVKADNVSNDYVNVIEVDLRSEADLQHEIQLKEALNQVNARCATCDEVRSVLNRTATRLSGATRAAGQPSGGTRFTTRGSSILWSGTGGGTFSVSLGLGWGPASVSIDRGRTGVIGFSAGIPDSMLGSYVALYINHTIEAREHRIYTRPRAMPNAPWRFSHTLTTTSVIRQSASIRHA